MPAGGQRGFQTGLPNARSPDAAPVETGATNLRPSGCNNAHACGSSRARANQEDSGVSAIVGVLAACAGMPEPRRLIVAHYTVCHAHWSAAGRGRAGGRARPAHRPKPSSHLGHGRRRPPRMRALSAGGARHHMPPAAFHGAAAPLTRAPSQSWVLRSPARQRSRVRTRQQTACHTAPLVPCGCLQSAARGLRQRPLGR